MVGDYKLSFTSASLLTNDSLKVAKIYYQQKKWPATKTIILKENILQRKKEGTIVRELQEIRHRLSILTERQFELLLNSNIETQKLILFLSVCKYYRFIREFVVEVLRHKIILFNYQIYDSDYEKFFSQKCDTSLKLSSISEKTKEKIKRVLFTILWQAGIIDTVKEKILQQPFLTSNLIEAIVKDNPEYLKVFLISDKDIKTNIKKYGIS
jgi:hypothetical protein